MIRSIFGPVENHILIPKLFRSYISEAFFQNCVACKKKLLHVDSEYIIEKAINNNLVEYEYALCMQCVDSMKNKLSTESIKEISEFLMMHSALPEKMNHMWHQKAPSVENSISHCIINNEPITELEEYMITAHCKDDQLLFSHMPYMVSIEAADKITSVLSAKTKDELDNFMDMHIGLPPEWMEIFKTKRPIFF